MTLRLTRLASCAVSLLCWSGAVLAQAPGAERAAFDPADYFDVWIHGVDALDLYAFTELDLDIQGRQGPEVFAYLSSAEIDQLFRLGYQLSIAPKAGAGALAGYPTFAELTSELQAFAAAFPTLCKLHSAGLSVQGRELWIVELSDLVGVEENEPEVRFVSTMHGDEVVGMKMCLEMIGHLLNGYGTDPTATKLLDTSELWIMPLMNPDGYVAQSRYNAQGFDLNREFPDRNSDPVNTTVGRPLEVQHLMNFGFSHSPVLSANFHGGEVVVNYPYDSDASPFAGYSATPDDGLMIASALTYAQLNPPMYQSSVFPQGIVNGVEWYTVFGGMQDWNYVWQGCNDVTIELSNQKWPNASTLPGYWNDNRDAMLAYLQLARRGLRGLVTDSQTGAALAATVRVVGVDHEVYTDPDVGDYHRMLLPGTYAVEVSAPGYVTQTVSGLDVPTGDALVVDVALVPSGTTGPSPDIRINGSDGPLTVSATAFSQVSVSLSAGSALGVPKDWWISVDNGSKTFWWTLTGGWKPAMAPAYVGGLFDLPSFTITNGKLPAGTWTFRFAVDAADGIFQGTDADTAIVTSS